MQAEFVCNAHSLLMSPQERMVATKKGKVLNMVLLVKSILLKTCC